MAMSYPGVKSGKTVAHGGAEKGPGASVCICLSFFVIISLYGCSSISGEKKNLSPGELAATKGAGSCFSGDCQNGKGVWRYDDGRRYEGSFIAGRPGGQGIIYMTTGSEFDGKFKYGQYDGGGNVIYGDGTYAECQRGNCIDGRGVLMFEDGSRYSGEFRDEIRTGYGGFEFEDGSTYSGNFEDNNFHGQGVLTLEDGTEYQGNFTEGRMDGEIRVHFPAGHQFIGLFNNGVVEEDQGRVHFPNNSRSNCVAGNCITGEGTLHLDDGSRYSGGLLNCSRHGYGVYVFKSGARYEGQFFEGKRHGRGKFIFPGGIVFEGTYVDGYRHGRGLFLFPDGKEYDVLYRQGKLVGRKH